MYSTIDLSIVFSVLVDGVEDTLVMHITFSTIQFKPPAAALHHSPLEQTLVVDATFKVNVFLALQLGHDDFYCFIAHSQAVARCCPADYMLYCNKTPLQDTVILKGR